MAEEPAGVLPRGCSMQLTEVVPQHTGFSYCTRVLNLDFLATLTDTPPPPAPLLPKLICKVSSFFTEDKDFLPASGDRAYRADESRPSAPLLLFRGPNKKQHCRLHVLPTTEGSTPKVASLHCLQQGPGTLRYWRCRRQSPLTLYL